MGIWDLIGCLIQGEGWRGGAPCVLLRGWVTKRILLGLITFWHDLKTVINPGSKENVMHNSASYWPVRGSAGTFISAFLSRELFPVLVSLSLIEHASKCSTAKSPASLLFAFVLFSCSLVLSFMEVNVKVHAFHPIMEASGSP